MRRLVLTTLATAVLGTGCFVEGGSTGSIDLYWQFDRTLWTGQAVVYDAEASTPAGTGPCLESGVDTVVVRRPDGRSATVDCRNQGSQGVALDDLPSGRQTFTVTGYRGDLAVYRSSVVLEVPYGTSAQVPAYTVDVFGVRADLDVLFYFASASMVAIPGATCASEAIDSFTFDLYDGLGTVVVSTSMFQGGVQDCSDAGVGPGVALDGIDLDDYTIRARAWRTGVTAPIYDSCDTTANTTARFLHDGTDVGQSAWKVLVLYKSCP